MGVTTPLRRRWIGSNGSPEPPTQGTTRHQIVPRTRAALARELSFFPRGPREDSRPETRLYGHAYNVPRNDGDKPGNSAERDLQLPRSRGQGVTAPASASG